MLPPKTETLVSAPPPQRRACMLLTAVSYSVQGTHCLLYLGTRRLMAQAHACSGIQARRLSVTATLMARNGTRIISALFLLHQGIVPLRTIYFLRQWAVTPSLRGLDPLHSD